MAVNMRPGFDQAQAIEISRCNAAESPITVIEYFYLGSFYHQAKCTCCPAKQTEPTNRPAAENWANQHIAQVHPSNK